MSYELEIKSNLSRLNQIAAILARKRLPSIAKIKVFEVEARSGRLVGRSSYGESTLKSSRCSDLLSGPRATSKYLSWEKLYTAVSSEAWAKLRVWASVAGWGRLLLSGSVAHASLETAVVILYLIFHVFMNEIQRMIVLPIRW